ncbi:MAG: methyltransferase domain-containing protein [Spirochaetaceae bacterium]|nr:methyltransferase domain-containing protein [Spirochaetaceae bacterium]
MDIIADRLRGLAGGRVLDLATGSGAFAARLAAGLASYDAICAVDSSPRALQAARANLAGLRAARVEEADAAALPYPDASFDTVAVANSLHHFADPRAVLAEAARVLAPGGRLLVLEMHREAADAPAESHVLLHHWWAAVDSAGGTFHAETLDRAAIRALMVGSCLSAESWDEVPGDEDDPLDPGLLAEIEGAVTAYRGKIAALREGAALPEGALAALEARGGELLARVRRVGFRSAPSLFFVGRKTEGTA